MRKLIASPLLPIFLIIFVGLMGFGIILPILPLYAETFRATPLQIGFLAGAYSLAQFVVTPYYGALSDRYGRRPLLVLSQVGTVIGFILLGLADSLWLLFVARIIDGISGGNIATAQAYISDVTDEKDRARAFGLIGAAFGLGFIVGPALGGILSADGNYSRAAYVAAGISFVSLILTLVLLPESRSLAQRREVRQPRMFDWEGLRSAWRIEQLGLLLVIFFVFNVAQAGFQNIFSLFGERRFGWGPRQNGFVLAYVGVLAVLIQGGAIGPLVRRYGERRLVQAGLLLLGSSLILTAFTTSWPLLLVVLIPLALGTSLSTPALNSLISRESPPQEFGRIIGLSQAGAALARVVGPITAGFALNHGGVPAPFLVAAVCGLVAFAGAMRLREPRRAATDPRFAAKLG